MYNNGEQVDTYDVDDNSGYPQVQNQNQNLEKNDNVPSDESRVMNETINHQQHVYEVPIGNNVEKNINQNEEYLYRQYEETYKRKGLLNTFALIGSAIASFIFSLHMWYLHSTSPDSQIVMCGTIFSFVMTFVILVIIIFDIIVFKTNIKVHIKYHLMLFSVVFFNIFTQGIIWALMLPIMVYKQVPEKFTVLFSALDGPVRILIVTSALTVFFIFVLSIIVLARYCVEGNYKMKRINALNSDDFDDSDNQ